MDGITAYIGAHWLQICFAATFISTLCSGIVAMTPTPPPDSAFRWPYKIIEATALVVGFAKDRGMIAPSASATALADEALELGKTVLASTKAVPAPSPPAPAAATAAAPAIDHAAVASATVAALQAAGLIVVAPPAAAAAPAAAPAAAIVSAGAAS